ncbi:HEPN domain-containing protein [Cellulomonas fimi]|uniref:ApeA N-terminal domain 1-containing protein n=1 Tax=Cellulomonas sp. RIT-PI-Y TaxID=3035297 RepID=UPI0021D7DA0D
MTNDLTPGVPRIGWFFDGDPTTPETSTLLQDTGEQITLTIPWITSGAPGQYSRWFHGAGVQFGDDLDRSSYSYEVPEQLMFRDVYGAVVLVGCRSAGMRDQMFSGFGQGVVRAQFAVLGAKSLKYNTINGLRSQLPGLSEWVGISSLERNYRTDEHGRLQSVDLHLESPTPIHLSRSMNLMLRPNYRVERSSATDTTEIRETVLVETRVKAARSWLDHLSSHNAVRDLLDVAAWSPFGYSNQWVLRDDDPERDAAGGHRGDKWSSAKTYAVRSYEQRARQRFLFEFDDIGPEGFRRWVRLRAQFARGLNALLSHFDHPRSALETGLIESSIGFEALGYQLALDSGLGKNAARNESYRERVQRVLDEVPVPLRFDTDVWVKDSADAYNGVKHANRDLPDVDLMLSTLRRNWLVARLWIAGRIRVAPSVLEANMHWWAER